MKLTPRLRDELKKPLGRLVGGVDSVPKGRITITVGDIASETLVKSGYNPKLCIYDAKTSRKDIKVDPVLASYGVREVRVKNPAGFLVPGVFGEIRRLLSMEGGSRMFVEGEEDLTTLAAIMEAPDGALWSTASLARAWSWSRSAGILRLRYVK
ncbi:MAG: DUF359 domain-containing protein [Candidatus Altiarchaeota archaeon]|nr:DUF359 domain-containing protein [Candidatus Altiarchaeota archaeon]